MGLQQSSLAWQKSGSIQKKSDVQVASKAVLKGCGEGAGLQQLGAHFGGEFLPEGSCCTDPGRGEEMLRG